MNHQDALRYPVGPFQPKPSLSPNERDSLIEELAVFPSVFRSWVERLTDIQLDTSYREGGWTIRQVVHHVPDSHMQGYVRFKLAISESTPSIKTYRQGAWGEMADARAAPVAVSLDLLDALHARWVFFIRSLSGENFARTYRHPELGEITLETTLQLYSWHGNHHLGHVRLVAGNT